MSRSQRYQGVTDRPDKYPDGYADTAQLELRGISKSFPGIRANDAISMAIAPGEIHALIGENGAGKSTLVKIIYGILQADSGQILWQGKKVCIASPKAARRLGIGMVFQHFSLFESLTVGENIELGMDGAQPRHQLARRITEIEERYALPLDITRHVAELSVGEKQRVEIIRCLLQDPKLLIMDEPTSVLTPGEITILFDTLRTLADEGCSILFISHKLEEVRSLCHNATILRGGKVAGTCDPRRESAAGMAAMMIGSALVRPKAIEREPGETRLQLRKLSLERLSPFETPLRDINLEVRSGEIVGIAGVAGNGQKALAAALAGEIPCSDAGMICLHGQPIGRASPRRRRILGMAFAPEERLGQGAVPGMSLTENALLTGYNRLGLVKLGLMRRAAASRFTDEVRERFAVKSTSAHAYADSLSGGNLQKFIMGREILQNPDVLIASQPTWGIDSGAESAIHQALMDLARQGCAVMIISQDLDELLALCNRLGVLYGGHLSEVRPVRELNREAIGLAMGGAPGMDGGAGAAKRTEAEKAKAKDERLAS